MIRWIVTITILFSVILGIAYLKYSKVKSAIAQFADFAPPPAVVTSMKVPYESWSSNLEAIGTFKAAQGVLMSSEESGKIIRLNFESGQTVNKGEVILQLDTSVEEAQLKTSIVKLDLAKITADRTRQLYKEQAATSSEIDDAESKLKQIVAEVASLNTTIQRKIVTAPFTGVLGIRQVQLGQYVTPGTTLVSLQNLKPIFLNFTLPQQNISQIKVGQKVTVKVDSYPQRIFEGTLTTIQPEVDAQTRNIQLQATFANEDEALFSGMFANVSLNLNREVKSLIIPLTAIQYAPYGDAVYVIEKLKNEKNGKEYQGARQQFIKLGVTQGDWVQVIEGLQEGQEIATMGVFKLRQGVAVVVNNEIQPNLQKQPDLKDR